MQAPKAHLSTEGCPEIVSSSEQSQTWVTNNRFGQEHFMCQQETHACVNALPGSKMRCDPCIRAGGVLQVAMEKDQTLQQTSEAL